MAFQTVTQTQSAPEASDAFGRFRISQPFTVASYKNLYDDLPIWFDDQETAGSGTSSTYDSDAVTVTLSVGASTAGTRVRQSRRRFIYQAGRSQQIKITRSIGVPTAGVTRRVGVFDDDNGLFFDSGPSDIGVTIRNSSTGSPVETRVAQSAWNQDKLDGTGPSGYNLDFSKIQLFAINFAWLGVGIVRFGFFIDGRLVVAHKFDNVNALDNPYMGSPNLPLRDEIVNDGSGAASDLVSLCSSIATEGSDQDSLNVAGLSTGISRDATSITISTTANYTPLISMRLKSDRLATTVYLQGVSIITVTNEDYSWALFRNPTVAGTDAASWVSAGANSSLEYDISRNTTNTLTGDIIAKGYGSTSLDLVSERLVRALALGAAIDGTQDEIVLAVINTTGGGEDYLGAINVTEVY